LGKKTIRIKDIAEKAGVSTGTVDRVLHKRGRVSPIAEKKVQEVLKALNYQPNFIARALGANKNYNVAVLMPDPAQDGYWRAPEKGIALASSDFISHGISLDKYIYDQTNPVSFEQQANELLKKYYDGVIVAPLFFQQYLAFYKTCVERKIPAILFNTNIKEFPKLSFIGQDSYQCGRLAAHLLTYSSKLNKGKIVILHLEDDLETSAHLMRKEKGFRDYFDQQEMDQSIIALNFKSPLKDSLVNHLDSLFDSYRNIQAIFVSTSKAFEVAAYLEGVGLSEILLIGFDLLPENIKYLKTGAIDFIINQNAFKQGYKAVECFVDYLILKKEVKEIIYLPLDVITKENVSYFLPQS